MKFKVIAITNETDGISSEQLNSAKIFSGKNAGICYMKDSYFDSAVSDPAKALHRFINAANNAHHSIADHIRVEVLFEDMSKMLAIVLNSLQDYSTSEKSGRYTIMTGNSEEEQKLYDKWCEIYQTLILNENPSIDDTWLKSMLDKKYPDNGYEVKDGKRCEVKSKLCVLDDIESFDWFYNELLKNPNRPSRKLAQENARYVLSVFTRSTTMGYSTSLRQWNYIYDWCNKFMDAYIVVSDVNQELKLKVKAYGVEASYYETELYKDFLNLSLFIRENLYVEELRDTKNRCFQFLTQLSNNDSFIPMYDLSHLENSVYGSYKDESAESEDDILDMVYSVSYTGSFVQIAQAERHRTLKYFMMWNHLAKSDFFIPELLRGTTYEDEWLADLDSIRHYVPQATMIGIIETGFIDDFVLKCKERLCSKAQWEIMNQTKLTAERFIKHAEAGFGNNVFRHVVLTELKAGDKVATKCKLCRGCSENCGNASNALTRKF